MTRRSRPLAWVLLAYLAVVGLVTIGPAPWRTRTGLSDYDMLSPATWLDPATWSTGASSEFTANILLFIPLGMLLRLTFPRATWLGAVALGAAVSTAIEVVQVWTPRISDPRDIVANTAGAAIGALVAAIGHGMWRLATRTSTRSDADARPRNAATSRAR